MKSNSERPTTTLFLIQSLDGKITTGDNDSRDTDKDFPRIAGIKEGLSQYYEIEKGLGDYYLNSGKVMKKVGMNNKVWEKEENDGFSFIIVDNKPHLTKQGCEYFARRSITFFLITSNEKHPAFDLTDEYENIVILLYKDKVNFHDAFQKLKRDHDISHIVIQTGGTLNAVFLRECLIDSLSIVVAPCLIGGKNTRALISGESLHTEDDLKHIKALKLKKCEVLDNSYLHLNYDVINNTVVEN